MKFESGIYYIWVGGSCDYGHKERAGGGAYIAELNGNIVDKFTTAEFNTTEFKMIFAKEPFNDDAQIRLKKYCDKIHKAGYKFMLSNSDCKGKNEEDNFFDSLYEEYIIERVWASRSINADPNKRGKLTEILVHNYQETQKSSHSNLTRHTQTAIMSQ